MLVPANHHVKVSCRQLFCNIQASAPATQLLVGETDFDHPFVQQEQMMPFVPFVRVKNVDEAIDKAIDLK